jgi:hypothetical protein
MHPQCTHNASPLRVQVLSELPDKIRKRIPLQVTDPGRLRALEDTKQAMKGVELQENSECAWYCAACWVGWSSRGTVSGRGAVMNGEGRRAGVCQKLQNAAGTCPPHGFRCPSCPASPTPTAPHPHPPGCRSGAAQRRGGGRAAAAADDGAVPPYRARQGAGGRGAHRSPAGGGWVKAAGHAAAAGGWVCCLATANRRGASLPEGTWGSALPPFS